MEKKKKEKKKNEKKRVASTNSILWSICYVFMWHMVNID